MPTRIAHKIVDEVELKLCGGCQQWLLPASFQRNSQTWDKLSCHCKDCIHKESGGSYRQGEHYEHRTVGSIELKYCGQCQQWQSIDSFSKDRTHRDGLSYACKHCVAEQYRAWQKTHIESVNAYIRQWRQDNPELASAINHSRRARERGAPGRFTGEEFKALCKAFGDRCAHCGSQIVLEPDHIIPLSRGGGNNIDNIQPLCRSCNASKGVQTISYREVLKGDQY